MRRRAECTQPSTRFTVSRLPPCSLLKRGSPGVVAVLTFVVKPSRLPSAVAIIPHRRVNGPRRPEFAPNPHLLSRRVLRECHRKSLRGCESKGWPKERRAVLIEHVERCDVRREGIPRQNSFI